MREDDKPGEEMWGSNPATALRAWLRVGEMLLEEAGVTRNGELHDPQRPWQERPEGGVQDVGGATDRQDGAGGVGAPEGVSPGEPGADGQADAAREPVREPVRESFAARLDAMTERARVLRRQSRIVAEVLTERRRQDGKYPGEKPGRGVSDDFMLSVLREEFWEAVFAPDAENLREEVVQVAACAIKWIEIMDARGGEVG